MPCTHAENGCSWQGPRHLLAPDHLPNCPYEAIKGFFAVQNGKMKDLEQENINLRRNLADLETKVSSQHRDLEKARVRLGPWFTLPPQGIRHGHSSSMGSSDGVPIPGPNGQRLEVRRRLSVPLNAAIFGVDDPTSRHARAPSLPNVNPGDPAVSQQNEPTDSTRPSFDDSFSSISHPGMQSTSAPSPLYPRAYSNNPVAPLNLTSSLEGTLTSLHQSIVALSSSMDSLERKQDIMLTTETLRMHEDVASLRAIVHGLRMQASELHIFRYSLT